jgi:hypothetical protein
MPGPVLVPLGELELRLDDKLMLGFKVVLGVGVPLGKFELRLEDKLMLGFNIVLGVGVPLGKFELRLEDKLMLGFNVVLGVGLPLEKLSSGLTVPLKIDVVLGLRFPLGEPLVTLKVAPRLEMELKLELVVLVVPKSSKLVELPPPGVNLGVEAVILKPELPLESPGVKLPISTVAGLEDPRASAISIRMKFASADRLDSEKLMLFTRM